MLSESKYSLWTEAPSGICTALTALGRQILTLRDKVRALITTQSLLCDSHELLGTANSVLDAKDIDLFPDMGELESSFEQKNMIWNAVYEVVDIRNKMMASKLGIIDTFHDLNEKDFNLLVCCFDLL